LDLREIDPDDRSADSRENLGISWNISFLLSEQMADLTFRVCFTLNFLADAGILRTFLYRITAFISMLAWSGSNVSAIPRQ